MTGSGEVCQVGETSAEAHHVWTHEKYAVTHSLRFGIPTNLTSYRVLVYQLALTVWPHRVAS